MVVCLPIAMFNSEIRVWYIRVVHLFLESRGLSEEGLRYGSGKKKIKKDNYISSPLIHRIWEENGPHLRWMHGNRVIGR